MHIIAQDNGGVQFSHDGHTFAAKLADLTPVQGSPDLLQTPEMTCTDAGCGMRARTVFPLIGGPEAQQVHFAFRLVAEKTKTAAEVLAALDGDIITKGGIVRRERG